MTSRRADGSATPARKSTSTSRTGASPAKKPRPQRARSGRRPGDSGTREQILESALHLFAERGYARTTIRAIAEDAEVDPALVHHFFSNKEGVFDAAVNSSLSVSGVFEGEGSATMSDAEWLTRSYLTFWENPDTRYAMTAIYRAGLADNATSDVLRARIETSIGNWANRPNYKDHPDAEIRTGLASGHLAGLAILRYVLHVEPLASMDFEEFVNWVTPALELRLTTLDPRA
ncbi:TetR/AcrR family transcriptional regulator [Streptomyces sp. CA-249302]|uniref:TetR/AcrR family transcriptional regulator n=1 Tax=Streptomyces sp. CA-249302 TaxID=3240058 RepID=UPI003D94B036